MKNIIIILVLVFLSCKDKAVQNKIESETIAIAETVSEVVDHGVETTYNEEIEDENSATMSKENTTNSNNYQIIRKVLYKGFLNETIKIQLYLNEQEHPCGGNLTILNAMYKYDNQDKWILLDVSTDREKKNFCMVEDGFSGVLFLEEKEGDFSGNWISTNTKKQFKVELKNQLLDVKYAKDHTIIEKLDGILFDDLIYGQTDC
jgi:hypothetical protein